MGWFDQNPGGVASDTSGTAACTSGAAVAKRFGGLEPPGECAHGPTADGSAGDVGLSGATVEGDGTAVAGDVGAFVPASESETSATTTAAGSKPGEGGTR
jgi:hypothetical protein